MANTYTQIHIQAVFVVKYRACLIQNSWKEELYRYIIGIIKENNHKPLIINGMPDHIHILLGLRPAQSISDLLKDIKGSSSKWINEKGFLPVQFSWQGGYGAFSYSKQDLPKVIKYIKNQEIHHKKKSFNEEYVELLHEFDIEYDNQFLFKPLI
ncbi:MAG: IS200/IS605 family transposase [Bacteroidetes bacterium]|jgi:putative transposase|nr:IS200/IS605 family transposase [Bacteroidota bacterium]MBT5530076.1 IS200/IS605 family transposase [Cytophagia bacterium]MBT3422829.1 IS200/IS605 family transposase [Bacteroidota bacterium]MBT3933335.1 IS200/IS605 family transposase [Bacteroidota bacterium]MBT4969407.1 IS200/IS605 family transposase [Bacteroidota bacterium]